MMASLTRMKRETTLISPYTTTIAEFIDTELPKRLTLCEFGWRNPIKT